MSEDTQPDSHSPDADEWISRFVNKLEKEFLHIVKSTYSRDWSTSDNQRALAFAFRRLLAESGMSETQMQAVLSDPSFGWTEAKNKRRFELIDKDVDDNLSFDEAQELESLTFQIRYANKPIEDDRVKEARQELEELKSQLEKSENTSN